MYDYQLTFALSKTQTKVAHTLLVNYQKQHNTIVNAVCGAGKTEMLLELLKYGLNQHHRIGIACPRKTLLNDLYKRISHYFKAEFSLLTGDVRFNNGSNLIFLTCHQLKRFPHHFDLLIIDEVDAFPFVDNYQLENDALKASKLFVYLSATLPAKYRTLAKQPNYHLINIYQRHHAQPIPVPTIQKVAKGFMLFQTLALCNKIKKPLLIYVPSIKEGQKLYQVINLFHKDVIFTYAKTMNNTILQQIKNKQYQIIISTIVLERGITIDQVNAIVFNANHPLYTIESLIQISGRVGRSSRYHHGTIIYLCYYRSKKLVASIGIIQKSNEMSHLS